MTWIKPDWPVPYNVQALASTRLGGVSQPPYDRLNLGSRCGDAVEHVRANRLHLQQAAGLPAEPCWLQQVHGTLVVAAHAGTHTPAHTPADAPFSDQKPTTAAMVEPAADGSWTNQPGVVCVAQSADCLPVLLADQQGRAVAAVHAGWRGLAAGVLEAAVLALSQQAHVPAQSLYAWLGPAISQQYFQVGSEVRAAFMQVEQRAEQAFVADGERWLADIFCLARQRLQSVGVTRVFGGDVCTYADAERFFSYRRDQVTGRMASMIWLQ